jgi:hypothetical protein
MNFGVLRKLRNCELLAEDWNVEFAVVPKDCDITALGALFG